MHRAPRLAALAVSMAAALPAPAQQHPVTFVAQVAEAAAPVRPGGSFHVALDATILFGWHLYSVTQPPGGPIATTIAVGPEALFRQSGPIVSPSPLSATDPNFGMVVEWYETAAHFALPVSVLPAAGAGRREALVRVRYQACTSRLCLPPREDTLRVPVLVGGSSAGPARAAPAAPANVRPALRRPPPP